MQYAEPWIKAGKIVNLVFYGSPTHQRQLYNGQSPCPSYILSQIHYVNCTETGVATPIYWESAYKENYKKFMAAGLNKFQDEPWVGYMRFGIGSVGEDFPAVGVPDGHEDCSSAWAHLGLTDQVWLSYTLEIIDYIASLGPKKPIILPINVYHRGDNSIASAVAERASKYGFAFGSQGFGGTAANSGRYTPFAALYQKYAGVIPLEIQTATNTGPDSREGLLPPLLDAALALNVQLYELYINEWFTANRPGPYASQYKAALQKLATTVGCGIFS